MVVDCSNFVSPSYKGYSSKHADNVYIDKEEFCYICKLNRVDKIDKTWTDIILM